MKISHPRYSDALIKYFGQSSKEFHDLLTDSTGKRVLGKSKLIDGCQIKAIASMSSKLIINKCSVLSCGSVEVIGVANWFEEYALGKSIAELGEDIREECIDRLELVPNQWYAVDILVEAIGQMKRFRNLL